MEGRLAAVVVQQNDHLRPTLLSCETTLTKAELAEKYCQVMEVINDSRKLVQGK